ncbi:unnamed protein product [Euphydryas editha]|uniref:DDE-1 domain-containing protein n=1 Tax=Euphydryas editha TaxID=104508 RepID=A0AAU9UAW6_EUPED|nr:unnamed protein product [Euphydryas editha]
MPRPKNKERKIGKHTKEDMMSALQLVQNGNSIRMAAKTCKIPYPTLRRYVKNKSEHGDNISLVPRYDINKVFTEEHEQILLKYYKDCALMFYGLTVKECRKVSYEMAMRNGIKMPSSWKRDKLAGLEWFRFFKKRHPDISVKKPETVSLARATSFNRETVAIFFNNLEELLKREPRFADGTRIFNLDETGTTTVQKPQKVVAPAGTKVGKVTSGEKGTLVTTCCMVSATGHALPPAIIFPRKNFKNLMMHGAPPGSLGLANPSGWMTSDLFVEVMKHFIKCSSTTPENPCLLIMDNHESHLSIEALDLAKQSGVVILTFHPHTTHKLQPLDVGLMGPLKTYYYSALESWMLQNPGKPVTIYEIARFIGHAYPRSMTPLNISAAFAKCGIFPFNKDIFSDEDFMPSSVTDRPVNVVSQTLPDAEASAILDMNRSNNQQDSTPLEIRRSSYDPVVTPDRDSPSILSQEHSYYQNVTPPKKPDEACNIENNPPKSDHIITPVMFRPPLKAGTRTDKRKGRKLGKSMIATDTPEKKRITEERTAAINRKGLYKRKVLQDCGNEMLPSTSKIRKILNKRNNKRRIVLDEDSETSEAEDLILESETDLESDEEDEQVIDEDFPDLQRKPMIDEYVIVLLQSKNRVVHYIAKIVEDYGDDEYGVSYLKLKDRLNKTFMFPLEPDMANVTLSDIKMILPPPCVSGTKRLIKYSFNVNLSLLNMA